MENLVKSFCSMPRRRTPEIGEDWGGWCLSPVVIGQFPSPSQGNTETHRTNNHAPTEHAHTNTHLTAI
ncbi:hypothetical protein CHARACLAT_008139 [Characodon lateralis]|uniref:Uncharacterized protein n=1 Tax=Characodon lateralis TaxID=208331 RepID=A0ABU7EHB2_9TELE|nr:hypothetical protein [Characodon lateralis]